MEKRANAPTSERRYHHGDLREALLAAAEQELTEKGVEGFTLRGVAKRANVSHAAPAHHFRDINELLTALATIGAERLCRSMTAAIDAASNAPRARFIASGIGYVAFAQANPALFSLVFGSRRLDPDDPDFMGAAGQAFAVLVGVISALTGRDPLQTPEGRASIMTAWSLVHGLANLLIAGRLGFASADFEADHAETIRRTIDSIAMGIEAGAV